MTDKTLIEWIDEVYGDRSMVSIYDIILLKEAIATTKMERE